MRCLRNFLCEESAATAVEYAVMIGLIILVAIGAVANVGMATSESFNESAEMLDGALGP